MGDLYSDVIRNRQYTTKDSGQREEFDTGARRDVRDGKGRYDLISPVALRRLAQVLERGAKKYGERNWEKGIPVGRYLDSAIRHIYQYIEGHEDEDHLGHAMWNIMAAIHTLEVKPELNDLRKDEKAASETGFERVNFPESTPEFDELFDQMYEQQEKARSYLHD